MQALLICCNIIAVLLYIIGTYAIVILYKMNKLGQGSKELQTEFLAHRLKLFIAFTLISVVLSISLFVGYALLVTRYDTNQISELYLFFILFSWFFSLLSIITFITGCVAPKWRSRNKNNSSKPHIEMEKTINGIATTVDTDLEQEMRNQEAKKQLQEEADWFLGRNRRSSIRNDSEQEQNENENRVRRWRERVERERQEREKIEQAERENERKSIEYFDSYKYSLIDKYAQSVNNFIEIIIENYNLTFISMFNDRDIPLSSTLIFPYRYSNSKILINIIERDGLKFVESANTDLSKKLQELTDFFVKGLKKRIQENNEWQDEFTLPVLLYTIVRNNVIKYYHNKYLEEYGFESLEEFCVNIPNATTKIATMCYVYFYIYETDINLSFVDTYHKICTDIKNIKSVQKEKKLENDLFGNPKKKAVSKDKNLNSLSPIERIDRMTGEEFELFMTNYFENQGFKTTHTPISGDYGIDLIIENDFGKIGVQAKCYSNKVSLDAVQQVVAGLRHYGLSSGIVITNNYFQPSAIRLAADNNITLWNRDKLIEKLGN